jgi:predicted membrane protein
MNKRRFIEVMLVVLLIAVSLGYLAKRLPFYAVWGVLALLYLYQEIKWRPKSN